MRIELKFYILLLPAVLLQESVGFRRDRLLGLNAGYPAARAL